MAEIGTDIQKAAELLKRGKLVAIPTETVYGLAGNAFNEEAVLSIFETKNRPQFDPLIVHSSGIEWIKEHVAEIPSLARTLMDEFWPGPMTLVLPKKTIVPDLVTSGLDSVAVRVPSHPMTQDLLRMLDFPLAAPSANPFGYVSPTTAQHVNDQLGDKIDYIIDGGECNVGIESTIIGFENGEITVHRLGGISVEEIEKIAGKVNVNTHSSSNPKAPGMLENHYSPTKPIILGNINELLEAYSDKRIGILSYSVSYNNSIQRILAPDNELKTAAKNLFAHLRWLDNQDIDVIIAEKAPENGLGFAINDRLKRASAKKN